MARPVRSFGRGSSSVARGADVDDTADGTTERVGLAEGDVDGVRDGDGKRLGLGLGAAVVGDGSGEGVAEAVDADGLGRAVVGDGDGFAVVGAGVGDAGAVVPPWTVTAATITSGWIRQKYS